MVSTSAEQPDEDEENTKPAIFAVGSDTKSPDALREWRPTAHEAVINQLAEGRLKPSCIADALKLPRRLVNQIALEHGFYVAAKKAELSKMARAIATKAAYRVHEELDECSAKDAAVIMGISIDKMAMLDGEPSQIVEHRHTADFTPLAGIMEASVSVIEAEVTDEAETTSQSKQD